MAKSTEILRGTYQGNQGGGDIQYSQAAARSSSNLISKQQQQVSDRPLKQSLRMNTPSQKERVVSGVLPQQDSS